MAALRNPILASPSRLQTTLSPTRIKHTTYQHQQRIQGQRRTFLSPSSFIPTPPVQKISASRTLPYPSPPIYNTIANVPLYASFLPYCLSSRVTHWSNADVSTGRKWPERAELEVGWGGVREQFASRIYCVPGKIVEAVAGSAVTQLRDEEIQHHRHDINGSVEAANGQKGAYGQEGGSKGMSSDILSHLSTRWEVEPVGKDGASTRVRLDIEVQFVSPVYAAMSQVAAEKVAEKMIEAFEKRIESEMKGDGEEKAAVAGLKQESG